ncbi:hypothetical protein FQN57_004539 [Myotisia sp. PD_48]|nr:hypothetical protein FQN57_004539 [Myotisia sp. PD_48]
MGFCPVLIALAVLCALNFFETIGWMEKGAEIWERFKAEVAAQGENRRLPSANFPYSGVSIDNVPTAFVEAPETPDLAPRNDQLTKAPHGTTVNFIIITPEYKPPSRGVVQGHGDHPLAKTCHNPIVIQYPSCLLVPDKPVD